MIQIYPAILAETEEEYLAFLQRLTDSPSLSGAFLHVDFADNKFVPHQTVKSSAISKHPLAFAVEFHFMVEDPASWLQPLTKLEPKSVLAHIEIAEQELKDFIGVASMADLQIGLAINPETPLAKLEPFMSTIQRILIMGIHPGSQGQEFLPETLERIKEAVKLREANKSNLLIGVDGGVSIENIASIVDAGADYVAIGSHLFKGDIDENLEAIWDVLSEKIRD